MPSSKAFITKVTFRAFDQTLTESFVGKSDAYIHEALSESCETYQVISKEEGLATLEFKSIDTLLQLKKASV